MTWMHFGMVLGYLVVLLAIIAFFRGASLVSRELEDRRAEDGPSDRPAPPAKRAA